MSNGSFDKIVNKKFGFLESDFRFVQHNPKKELWGYEIVYTNKTTGVKIVYEYKEAYVFIFLYRLIDGELIEDPRNVNKSVVLNSHSLDDIVNLRNPEALIKPTYQYPIDSKYHDKRKERFNYVASFASNLSIYARDVLEGDFGIFTDLDKIVKERIRRFN